MSPFPSARLAFGFGQSLQGFLVAQAGQVGIHLPVLQRSPDLRLDLGMLAFHLYRAFE